MITTTIRVLQNHRVRSSRDAWARGQALAVHGWVYDLHDGLLRDLGLGVAASDELAPLAEVAVASGGRLQR